VIRVAAAVVFATLAVLTLAGTGGWRLDPRTDSAVWESLVGSVITGRRSWPKAGRAVQQL